MRGGYRPLVMHVIRLRTAKQFEVAGEIDVGDADAQFRGRWQVASAGFDQKFFQFAQDARRSGRQFDAPRVREFLRLDEADGNARDRFIVRRRGRAAGQKQKSNRR